MRVATFNINGINTRLQALLDWLEREQPDVVCLQELKAPEEAFPAGAIADAGYGSLWHGQKSWNGVAILARGAEPVEIGRGLPGDPEDTQSRYIEAAVEGLVVVCLYLPNGNPQPGPKFDYKLAWMDRLLIRAQQLYDCGQPVVMAGDYNVVPTDEDIYNPKSWRKDALLQPESRERYRQLLDQGWLDSLRHVFGEERVYTFWDYFRQHWERDAGLRIDHLLLNAELAPRLRTAGVDRWVRGEHKPSDHAPTWIELSPPKRAASKRPRKAARKAAGTTRKRTPRKRTSSE